MKQCSCENEGFSLGFHATGCDIYKQDLKPMYYRKGGINMFTEIEVKTTQKATLSPGAMTALRKNIRSYGEGCYKHGFETIGYHKSAREVENIGEGLIMRVEQLVDAAFQKGQKYEK